ncbi:MAG: TRAP transporter small permease [Desulfovibrionaceae bacterium]|nr:TRAP transporter small permease [Desulfovibrionaceae bacterium]
MEEAKGLLGLTERTMRFIAAVCLAGMAAMTGMDVFLRGAFNTPIFGCEEIVTILGVVAVGFALPYAHRQKSHIGVEILVRRLPARIRRRLKLVTDSATLVLLAIVTWRMYAYAGTLAESGEVSMNLELPEYMVVYVLSFGFLVYAVCLLADIVKFFKGGRD